MSEKKYVSDSKLAHYHNKLKNKIANDNATTLSSAKSYADSTIDSKVGSAIGSAKKYTDDEVAGLAAETSEALEALTTAVNNKSSKTHNHAITDVTNLRNELDSKANKDEVGSLYVTITANDNGYISDVSFNEIIEAYLLGRPIYALIGEFTLPLYMASSEMVGFVIQAADEAIMVLISSENDVQAEFVEFTADMFGADEFGAADKALQSAKTYTDTKTSALSTQISTKASQSSVDELSDGLSAHKSASNPHNITKSTIGLGSVDNTSDASKPVSTAQATAIADAKKAGTDAQSAIDAHEALTNNPHSVTAAQVGLGNVPNVTTNNQKPTFTVASSLSALTSGNSLSTQFGKIAKAINDLIAHLANKSNPHGVTAAQVGADPAGSANAVQANLNTLNDEFDDHTENADIHFTAAERTKLSGIATGANKYTHPNSGVTAGTYKSVTVNAAGHVTGGTNPTTLAGYGITDAEPKGTATSTVGTHNTSGSSHNDIRIALSELNAKVNNFLNVDDTTKDQLNEIIALIEANADDIKTITSGKVNVADIIDNLTTNVTNKPLSAAQGVALKALIDALDSDKVDKVSGKGLSTNDYTTTEKNKLSGIASGAEVNQNAFSNILVGTTTVAADAKTDTVEFVGDNVTITPDATNDKITFAVASGTTSAAGIVKLSNSTSSTSTSLAATPKAVKSAYDLANTAKTNAATAQTTADSASDAAAAAQSTADTATTNLSSHTGNTSNPHSVTKAQVGLGNVPNVTTNNQTPTYTVATSNAELTSGETISTAFGKLAKAVSSLIAHLANVSNPHSVTKSQVGLGNVDNTADADKTVKAAGTATTATTLSGLTATVAELNYVDGVTSSIQTQLNNKANSSHGHANATEAAAGFMSPSDKTKLDATNVAWGTCSTAAATAEKVITISGNTNWALTAGAIIAVKFSYTNTASNPTFNVNGTGAKSVWYSAAVLTTSSLSYAGYKDRPCFYIYDGTQFVFLGWSYYANTTYTNVKLGHGYGTCTTAAATTAKVVTLSSYTLVTGGIVAVKFTYAVPANATLNINSKGAKAIYHRGAKITAGVINAGDTATFMYNGSYYHLLSVDRDDDTTYTLPTASSSTLGGVKTTSTVTSTSGLTACPIISGVPYYKDTDTTYSLSSFGITATAAELNKLDGVTATATELNYVDGVTSNIQTQLDGKSPTSHTHDNWSLGHAYCICSTAAATVAKTVSLTGFTLKNGGIVVVKFIYAVPDNATLNISGTGAKQIIYRSDPIVSGIIKGGDTATFAYDGSYYELLSVDRGLYTDVLHVSKGGTGADNAEDARTNLGITVDWLNGIHNHLNGSINPAAIEFYGASGHGGYLDFHFGASSADYTSRIIEGASGQITINAPNGTVVAGAAVGTAFVRNIKASTSALTSGSSTLATGDIHLTYE